ncbi:MAG TPA: ATP synthase subunit I [Burkholderiales bacterium]|nr:ATP synthase subunit I [Burkholderiales bacterium]
MRLLRSRPIRVALGWQGGAALALTAIGWVAAGPHAGWSALLGALVGIVAVVISAAVGSIGGTGSAGLALLAVLRAEAVKIALIVVLLWLVLKIYKDASVVWFIGSFLVSILILVLAPLVRDQ